MNVFLSVPVRNEEGDPSFQFFQILSLQTRAIVVKTFAAPDEDDPEHALYKVSAQPLERWRPSPGPLTIESAPQEVFVYHDPCMVDILEVCGGLEHRESWLVWEPCESDVQGCLAMTMPKRLAPNMPLSSPSIPVVCLLDALCAQGFVKVSRKVWHTSDEEHVFDGRNIASKRKYLQCVLALPELLPKVTSFPSGEPAAFYALLLHTKMVTATGLGEKAYKAMLADAVGDGEELCALEMEQVAPVVPLPLVDDRQAPALCDADSIVGSDDEPGPAPAPAQGDDHIVGDDSGGEEGRAPVPSLDDLPEAVLGQRLRRVHGRQDGKWSYEDRLSVSCSNPAHDRCRKSRSVALDGARFGPLSAMYFLGAWLEKSAHMTQAEHKRYVPSQSEVQGFADTYHSV